MQPIKHFYPVLPFPAAVANVDIHPTSSVWGAAPAMGPPETASTEFALFVAAGSLWLSYPSEEPGSFAVVAFEGYVEHQMSNLDDGTLKNHPYASAGLVPSAFNELSQSLQTIYWAPLGARHWVVSLWNCTLDVVARTVRLVEASVAAKDPRDALMKVENRANGA